MGRRGLRGSNEVGHEISLAAHGLPALRPLPSQLIGILQGMRGRGEGEGEGRRRGRRGRGGGGEGRRGGGRGREEGRTRKEWGEEAKCIISGEYLQP